MKAGGLAEPHDTGIRPLRAEVYPRDSAARRGISPVVTYSAMRANEMGVGASVSSAEPSAPTTRVTVAVYDPTF